MVKTTNNKNKVGVFYIGISLTIIIGLVLGYNLFKGDKTYFLSGQTTHGHYQIELECESCHNQAFSGDDAMQKSCESCHADELENVNDSHPRTAFTDPRNIELLQQLDVRYCVTCHREHKPELTRNYGVTLAGDFCFHCHQDIAEERKSHQGMEFNNCTTSGCHNFHDNSMLYEKFLTRHIDTPSNKNEQLIPSRTGLKRWLKKHKKQLPLEVENPDQGLKAYQPSGIESTLIKKITHQWQKSVHAKVGANCSQCHTPSDSFDQLLGLTEPLEEKCGTCHTKQKETFLEGKHGMRLKLNLSPMSTKIARSQVEKEHDYSLSCSSCHNPHSLNVQQAAVESCLNCHKDTHSQNYKKSKHFGLWQQELNGQLPENSGVSCASCHLPRMKRGRNVTVVHNQNMNLKPNTKMLKKVCMNCHGLKFSLSALADKELIQSNFNGTPSLEHQTFEMIKQRILEKNQPKLTEE